MIACAAQDDETRHKDDFVTRWRMETVAVQADWPWVSSITTYCKYLQMIGRDRVVRVIYKLLSVLGR